MARLGHDSTQPPTGLLSIALRSRVGTVSELAGLALQDEAATRRELAVLEEQGYVILSGDRISYREPDVVIAERAAGLLTASTRELSARVAEATALIAAVPGLMDNWALGRDDDHDLHTEIFHGPFAPTDLWLSQAARRRIRSTDGMLPDATRMFGATPEAQQVWHDAVGDPDHRVRTILAAADLSHPGAAAVIEADAAVGGEFRMLEHPPSWFWISDNEIVGLPLVWGEAWPTSVVAIRSEAVVSLVRWVYDTLWASAVPVTDSSASWDPLLMLMVQGATLESASQALGISSRTGRRRVTEAMDYFEVKGAVALGAAWQRERTTRG